ncbi:MAG: right-handed parallel beta-helix repeat-containing protein [Bacteroidota bacterium]|nr:right-handed parallel beta-helix repeat-containing protein [Bacteroidota bacterium]
MKKLFLLPLIIFGLTASATNYYISSSGNDANNGTSTSTPWKTLSKLNAYFSSLKPGDNVLFNRGDVFYGSIIVNKSGSSGSPITLGAYGTGANPVITGFTTVSSWTNLGSNIWESTSAVSTLPYTNMVVINGVNTAMGRYPNTGYLTYQSHSGNSSITSSGLLGSPNWTGAELAMFVSTYTIGRYPIISQSGGKVYYNANPGDESVQFDGQGFIIQNDARTLDVQNEWYYDPSTKKLKIYSTSSPTGVQISTIETTISLNGKSYITFDNISFQGSNTSTLGLISSTNITIQNCDFNYAGIDAIHGDWGAPANNLIVSNCSFNHSNNCGIDLTSDYNQAVFQNNNVRNSGIIPFMMSSGGGASQGMNVQGQGNNIAYNIVDSSGYNGIRFWGNNAIVQNNFINNSCLLLKDGGGIYTYNGYPNTIQTGMKVLNNIVLNSTTDAGIYLDDKSNGIEVSGNTVGNCNTGIYLHNNHEISVHNNTIYNSSNTGLLIDTYDASVTLANIDIRNNIFFERNTTPNNRAAHFYLLNGTMPSTFTLDNNYYARPIDDNLTIETHFGGYNDITLAGWRSLSGRDVNSKKSPKTITDVNDLRFEYNATSSSKTVALDANYIDVTGKSYPGSITLAPFTSSVLIRNGPITNQLPVANAGPDQTVLLPISVDTLKGSGTDSDGNISSYNWNKISGPSVGSITTATSAATTVTGLVQGIYQFELTVTDNAGATGRDTMQLTVNATLNQSPTANAGADQAITLPLNTVTLNGSGKDTDGTIVNFFWTKISGPTSFNIVNTASPITDVSGLVQGVYQFELQVTDNNGAVGKDTVKVTVNAAANIVPVANAGPNKTITLPVNTVSLTGSGTDVDGTITNYLWTKISGPSLFNIVNATSPVTDVSGLVQGVYIFQLRVTDNNGAAATSTMQVTVNAAANISPVVNAGPDQTIILPTNTVSLAGSGTDVDGTVTNYLWTKISGPSTFNIVNASSPVTNVLGLVQGVYQFELQATDNNGAVGTDIIQVVVNATANLAPIANAGLNQTITLPVNNVTLSGSGTDVDGTVVSYLWTKISGPSTFNIVNAASPVTDVSGLIGGVYQFQLQVTDNNGQIGTDIIQVSVNSNVNLPPIANAGSDQTIILPINSTTLSGSGSDADGTVVSYLWTKLSGPSSGIITNTDSASTSVTGLVQGVYQFELQATDDKGATGTDIIQVTVNAAANISPVANAGLDQTITLPTNSTTLSGSGSDADGTVVSYLWTKLSGPSSGIIANTGSSSTSVSGLVQGVYQFQLEATDNKGATGTDIIQVTVNAATNISPVANAGLDQTITLPTNSITLSGSGIDADGTVGSYLWTKISGPSTFNIVNPASPVTDVSGMVQGVYLFQLEVTDNNGAKGTNIMQVTVKSAVNIPPSVNAGSDQIITLPADSVILSGSGSDTDGTVVSYLWTKISGPSSFNIVNASSPNTSVTGLVRGVYKFRLKVTDNNGAARTDVMQVTVNAPVNIAPVANAGPDQTITLPINSVTLSGSGSDADGAVVGYLWTKISGPSSGSITNINSASTSVSGLIQGVYQYQLQVTDNNGAVGTNIINVTVNAAANIAPIANAGGNQTITLPLNSVILSGSGTDTDGTVVSYLWTKISGPSSFNIVNPTSPVTDVSNLVKGIYQFELKVTDNSGAIATSMAEVIVNEATNIAPVANVNSDKTITLPVNTTSLAGSGSDVDGTVVSYLWTKISGPSTFNIVNAFSPVTDVSGLVQGIYQFELKVTDNAGATGRDTMKITVNAVPNVAPVANAGSDQTITLPTNTASLVGSGTDADGSILSYRWSKTSGPSSGIITNTTSSSTMITGLVQGIYVYQLKVTDNNGATATSSIQITVNSGVNISPVANAGQDITISSPVSSVNLVGSGTDNDGSITRYEWKQVSGPVGPVISNANLSATAVNNLNGGTYEFELTVTDNNGATGKDTMVVVAALSRLSADISNNLKVYPNPVISILTVEISSVKSNSNMLLVISDFSGRMLYKEVVKSSQNSIIQKIDMSNYGKGAYTITLFFDGKDKQSVKILKL